MNGLTTAQRAYDRMEPTEHVLEDWPATNLKRFEVTDDEIEETIKRIADTGYYDDELGRPTAAGDVLSALATDWIHNRAKLPGTTYHAFLRWATAVASLAKYGK